MLPYCKRNDRNGASVFSPRAPTLVLCFFFVFFLFVNEPPRPINELVNDASVKFHDRYTSKANGRYRIVSRIYVSCGECEEKFISVISETLHVPRVRYTRAMKSCIRYSVG